MAQLQVGSTPLYKSIELTGRCNGASVYVKREDKNPFGTFKDRRCHALLGACAENAVFVHITSGNSGYSLGKMAEALNDDDRNVQVVNIVDKHMPRAIRKKLESCSIVHRMDLSHGIVNDDTLREVARACVMEKTGKHVEERDIVNVESHGLVDGYRRIIKEIAADGVKPTYIFCPVGGGELVTELAAQAADTWGREAPKIIGVTIKQNVLTKAKEFLRKPGKSIADKLVSGYSKFKSLVKKGTDDGTIKIMTAAEGEIAREYGWLNQHGISAEPSAAAAFCGAVKYDLKPTDTVVIINTGKGVYDHSVVEKRWLRRVLRGLKYAAVAGVTAAALTAAGWCWLVDHEHLTYMGLFNEASAYADKNHKGYLDSLDKRVVNYLVRGDTGTAEKGISSICDLTPRELEFYVNYKRAETMNDAVGRDIIIHLRRRWDDGKFRCTELHPGVPFLYTKIGDSWFARGLGNNF